MIKFVSSNLGKSIIAGMVLAIVLTVWGISRREQKGLLVSHEGSEPASIPTGFRWHKDFVNTGGQMIAEIGAVGVETAAWDSSRGIMKMKDPPGPMPLHLNKSIHFLPPPSPESTPQPASGRAIVYYSQNDGRLLLSVNNRNWINLEGGVGNWLISDSAVVLRSPLDARSKVRIGDLGLPTAQLQKLNVAGSILTRTPVEGGLFSGGFILGRAGGIIDFFGDLGRQSGVHRQYGSRSWSVWSGEPPSPKLHINAVGNIGIGTVVPNNRLEVIGNVEVAGAINTSVHHEGLARGFIRGRRLCMMTVPSNPCRDSWPGAGRIFWTSYNAGQDIANNNSFGVFIGGPRIMWGTGGLGVTGDLRVDGTLILSGTSAGITAPEAVSFVRDNNPRADFKMEGSSGNYKLVIKPSGVGGINEMIVETNFVETGPKAAVVETEHFGQRKLYVVEASEVKFMDEGQGELINGEAKVYLDQIFLETIDINKGYLINHLTVMGQAASLYVAEKNPNYFIVKADPAINAKFDWRISAYRKGYGNLRLEKIK